MNDSKNIKANALEIANKYRNIDKNIDIAKADEVAEKHGFISREKSEYYPWRRSPLGPCKTISIRAPIKVYERFVAFCDKERFSYWEAINHLMGKQDI